MKKFPRFIGFRFPPAVAVAGPDQMIWPVGWTAPTPDVEPSHSIILCSHKRHEVDPHVHP